MKPLFICMGLLPLAAMATPPVAGVVSGNNQLAFDLFRQLPQGKNTFFSPYSIASALGMTYGGAKDQTAKEMEKVLHISDPSAFHENMGELTTSINRLNGTDVKMSVANRIFAASGFQFLASFTTMLEDIYRAPMERLDFVKKTEPSRQHINQWVEKQTNNRIQNLLLPGTISESTRMVLVNAIYFYGDWAHQFRESATQTGTFYLGKDKTMQARLMFQQEYFQYAETNDFKAIRVPYKGNALSMEIYLPHATGGLDDFEKTLDAVNYAKWAALFNRHKVRFTLPRFTMTASFMLSKELSKMGMPTAFTPRADFSGMTGDRSLFISEVVHKAFVDVGEKGTEAAAATAVIMRVTSVAPVEHLEIVKDFKADHPFVFVIRDNQSGCILFMGRMTEPQKA